ncbi:MAG: hypothetical protein ACTS3F_12590 [Phycisphaerales bacterium]
MAVQFGPAGGLGEPLADQRLVPNPLLKDACGVGLAGRPGRSLAAPTIRLVILRNPWTIGLPSDERALPVASLGSIGHSHRSRPPLFAVRGLAYPLDGPELKPEVIYQRLHGTQARISTPVNQSAQDALGDPGFLTDAVPSLTASLNRLYELLPEIHVHSLLYYFS